MDPQLFQAIEKRFDGLETWLSKIEDRQEDLDHKLFHSNGEPGVTARLNTVEKDVRDLKKIKTVTVSRRWAIIIALLSATFAAFADKVSGLFGIG